MEYVSNLNAFMNNYISVDIDFVKGKVERTDNAMFLKKQDTFLGSTIYKYRSFVFLASLRLIFVDRQQRGQKGKLLYRKKEKHKTAQTKKLPEMLLL